ncbi:hypothetical protein MSAN_02136500 [Mycena sanguinolenta]|uniref:Uncharacterized protein n=1 Tax=Mycena sanguinolenta TaxID=230812 RepID=A0A8H7CK92_9AGAR|nr:hypothetical protein MSAN_02136500 [Mycena sanguinolenta]
MRRFSMMISYRLRKFWIVIESPILRRFIFMRNAISEYEMSSIAVNRFLMITIIAGGIQLYLLCIPTTALGIPPYELVAETIPTFIHSLKLEQYHRICAQNLGQFRDFDISASTTVNLGVVYDCSNDLGEGSVEIAFLPSVEAPYLGDWTVPGGGTGEVMLNGWTRFQSGDVINSTLYLPCSMLSARKTWLSQANFIFRRLDIISNFEDYVVVNEVAFYLNILQTTGNPPEGFLFLCSGEDFRTGPSSYCRPSRVAYWSLDPSGVDRLSPEEATQLGFPTLKFTFKANGWYWDSSVYEGLRQFHKAKGFDPYSQGVARHLGEPLYQVSPQANAPFAHVNGDDVDAESDWESTADDKTDYPHASTCEASDIVAEYWHSEKDMYEEEMTSPSRSLNVMVSIQLVSILFLALSWMYDHISVPSV